MRNIIKEYMDFVEGRMAKPELWQELGLENEQAAEVRANVNAMLADWICQCRGAADEIAQSMDGRDLGVMKEVMQTLKDGNPEKKSLILSASGGEAGNGTDIPADAQPVFERSGWEHAGEWIGEIPDVLGSGKQNFFRFEVREDSPVSDPGFPTLLLAVMAVRYNAMNGGMYFSIGLSGDGQNHFTLLQK